MDRLIKFRAWDKMNNKMILDCGKYNHYWFGENYKKDIEFMQFTGLLDKNGKEIYEGDVIEFVDKWEWYKGQYAIDMMFAVGDEYQKLQQKYEAESMHRFVVEFQPTEGYNLSKYDLSQNRYEVIGNIWENSDLVNQKQ